MSKARILVIDDQLYFRSYIEGLLEDEGYEAQTAESGAAGLEMLEHEGPFGLVLTDLVMPGMDGIETVRRIRERWPDLDVLVVTGVGDVRAAVEALRVGAADYLLKPVQREDLAHAIESVLELRRLRGDQERLISENRAFLGVLSVVDRGLSLLGHLRRAELAQSLLEMLCVESKAHGGVLWVREEGERGQELVRVALRGTARVEDEPERLAALPEGADGLLRLGKLEVEKEARGGAPPGPVLWVPAVREGSFFALARLQGFDEGHVPAEIRAACAKLGEIGAIALQQVERAEDLERRSLRDPLSGLHTRAALEEAVTREIHRGQRYGRTFVLLCVEVGGAGSSPPEPEPALAKRVGAALERSLRAAEVIATEGSRRFWVLVPEADPVASVALKGRLVSAIDAELEEPIRATAGAANFPVDGESFEVLTATARARIEADRQSLVRSLRLSEGEGLEDLARRLRYQAEFLPASFVPDALQLVLDEIRARPDARGLLFLAPGRERASVFSELSRFGSRSIATELFVATDGDTVPTASGVTALPLPRGMSPETTWVVRFGEAPPYVLIAGPPSRNGGRPIFHSDDRSLVEHVVSKLRTEVGFGVRARG